jgi:hypothetical protein
VSTLHKESALDRLVTAALEPKPHMTLEFLGAMQHQSAWGDVVSKAKRLIQTGKVTINHNGPTLVDGHVIGDHGEYNTEISRHDPASSIIEQWKCDCPWFDFAFQRTRKWKKLEGRVCSHVLATYWRAKSTPLDEGSYDEEGHVKTPFQRYRPLTEDEQAERAGIQPGDQLPMDIEEDDADAGELPRSFGPEDLDKVNEQRIQENAPQPQQPQAPPTRQDIVLPKQPRVPTYKRPRRKVKPQRGQMNLFDVTLPPGAEQAQMQMQPPPKSVYVNNPPDPNDPLNSGPSRFSHAIPVVAVDQWEFHYSQKDGFEEAVQQAMQQGQRSVVQLLHPAMLEQRGGKVPHPTAQPIDYTGEGVPKYRMLDLGWDEQEQRRIRADERPNGAPEERGRYSEAPAGRRAEVTDIEPSMKMVHIHVPLNDSGPLHPHYLAGWVSYDDVMLVPDARAPFWQRR